MVFIWGELKYALVTLLIGMFMVFTVMFLFISCSSSTWNNGICIDCDVNYELEDVSNQFKYYVCPKCNREMIVY